MAHIGFVSTSVLESKDGVSLHAAKNSCCQERHIPCFPENTQSLRLVLVWYRESRGMLRSAVAVRRPLLEACTSKEMQLVSGRKPGSQCRAIAAQTKANASTTTSASRRVKEKYNSPCFCKNYHVLESIPSSTTWAEKNPAPDAKLQSSTSVRVVWQYRYTGTHAADEGEGTQTRAPKITFTAAKPRRSRPP